jgi:hypothetical protein
MSRAFGTPAHCQECGKRFDAASKAWEAGKGGVVGWYGDFPNIPPPQRGQPFAYCRRCLDTSGYDCHTKDHRPLRERRREAIDFVAKLNRAQIHLVKGVPDEPTE